MEPDDPWAAQSTEAVKLALVRAKGKRLEFEPAFTYPIYGDKELIYGYKELELKVDFDAASLVPLVQASYTSKLPNADSPGPVAKLLEFMDGEDTTTDEDEWEDRRKTEIGEDGKFKVPGEVVKTFKLPGKKDEYKLYKCNLRDARQLHLRMQLFVLLFIEAGSYIDADDDKWELYVLYNDTQQLFVGFSTVYRYFWYQNAAEHEEEHGPEYIRKRISQFVILPPFQGTGLGARLYGCLVEEFLADKVIKEITVEDPSEAFDDLRDRCDLERLHAQGFWSQLKLPLDREWAQKFRHAQKMAPRQYDRCLEMALLDKFGAGKPNRQYRLLVKERLYLRNRDALNDMELDERQSKLHETYERLIEDYYRIKDKVMFGDAKGKKRAHSELDV